MFVATDRTHFSKVFAATYRTRYSKVSVATDRTHFSKVFVAIDRTHFSKVFVATDRTRFCRFGKNVLLSSTSLLSVPELSIYLLTVLTELTKTEI